MATDKIIILPTEAVDEASINTMLDNANIHRQAATVIRGGNGQVIRVEVNLPPTASAAASASINSNPGVAAAIDSGLTPGTEGTGGDQATYDALIALPGVTETISNDGEALLTDNLDGTLTISEAGSDPGPQYALIADNLMLPYPNVAKTEIRYKFLDLVGVTFVRVDSKNTGQYIKVFMTAFTNTMQIFINDGPQILVPLVADTNFHIVNLLHEANAVAVELDGAEVFRQNTVSVATNNQVVLQIGGSGVGNGVTLDYFRWTENI